MSSSTFVALINPKSGGNEGPKLLQRFREILPPNRVYDLTDPDHPGPSKALEDHQNVENLRLIACGGDGTVGWVLAEMDKMTFPYGRPPIGIIPLGTGNDLSRSLNWGGKYKEKPLQKVLLDIEKSTVINMDRWVLSTKIKSDNSQNDDKNYATKLPQPVFNNYFSLGIDAHIALKFHEARNENPEYFSSRTTNLIFYGKEGFKDLFKNQWSNLMESVSIECDDVDYTQKLKDYGAHALLFLNIKSYSGGTHPWRTVNKGVQAMDDGLLEVIALDNLDLALLHLHGTGKAICQCKKAVIRTTTAIPMQVDGEPCMMQPCCAIEIGLDSEVAKPGVMLCRDKQATYGISDEEIQDWAARTIQNSFKKYHTQKRWSDLQLEDATKLVIGITGIPIENLETSQNENTT